MFKALQLYLPLIQIPPPSPPASESEIVVESRDRTLDDKYSPPPFKVAVQFRNVQSVIETVDPGAAMYNTPPSAVDAEEENDTRSKLKVLATRESIYILPPLPFAKQSLNSVFVTFRENATLL